MQGSLAFSGSLAQQRGTGPDPKVQRLCTTAPTESGHGTNKENSRGSPSVQGWWKGTTHVASLISNCCIISWRQFAACTARSCSKLHQGSSPAHSSPGSREHPGTLPLLSYTVCFSVKPLFFSDMIFSGILYLHTTKTSASQIYTSGKNS